MKRDELVKVESESELRPGAMIWGHCDCGRFHECMLGNKTGAVCIYGGGRMWKAYSGCPEFAKNGDEACLYCAIPTRGVYRLPDEDTQDTTTRTIERPRETVR